MESSERRHAELERDLPASREALGALEERRDEAARTRARTEGQRTDIARRLGDVRLELGQAGRRPRPRRRATGQRGRAGSSAPRRSGASIESPPAAGRAGARGRRDRAHLAPSPSRSASRASWTARTTAEQDVRLRLGEQRRRRCASWKRSSRSGPRRCAPSRESGTSLESPSSPRCGSRPPPPHARRQAAQSRSWKSPSAAAPKPPRWPSVTAPAKPSASPTEAERARHLVAELRAAKRWSGPIAARAEETLAQLTARRQALEELERDRVGLAPGAAALLAVTRPVRRRRSSVR